MCDAERRPMLWNTAFRLNVEEVIKLSMQVRGRYTFY